MKKLFFAALALCSLLTASAQQIFEWRIYTLTAEAAGFDEFVSGAMIPAYNDHGVKVGAFAPDDKPGEARYLLLVWPDIETFQKVSRKIREDKALNAAAYFAASAASPAYSAEATYLCEAFDKFPRMLPIAKERGLFEFRVYRSPNAEANERKIRMFENGEVDIFDSAGIDVACFGRTLAGPRMPSLVYLTWYADRTARDAAWSRFGADPRWRQMSSAPEYAHTATDNLIQLLRPLDWSQY